ncbi:hypothetical protein, partial [Acidisphaera sp. L21]|uniref:beta strand repeat-containing protein n=1 Tax=Acidisphaera sp. L21 TaxID=1641851 RepID=UPI001C205DAE
MGGGISQTAGSVIGSTLLSLTASGAITQTGGTLAAATLSGSAGGATTLTSTGNAIATLGSFISNGGFALTDGGTLSVTGPVTDTASIGLAVTGNLSLAGTLTAPALTTTATGAISQPGGSVQVTTLAGSAASASFGQVANKVTTLGAFTSKAGFSLSDAAPLTVAGAVTGTAITILDDGLSFGTAGSIAAPGGTVQLAALSTAGLTVGGGSGISGTSPVTAATLVLGTPTGGPLTITGAFNLSGSTTLDLESAGAISETGAGGIAANTLGGAGASAALTGANAIGTLAGFTTTAGFALTNGQGLTVAGPLAAASAAFNVAGDLALTGTISAPSLSLVATGAVTQTAGSITTASLTGSAGSLSLTSSTNAIGNVGPYTATTSFTLTDGQSLTVAGAIDPPDVTMNVAGDLTLHSSVTGATVTLNATGAITEGAAGSVAATVLTGSANSAAFSSSNAVATLGDFTTKAGFSLVNTTALGVAGTVSDAASISLSSVGPLTLTGTIAAPTTRLVAMAGRGLAGDIVQTAGSVTGSTLLSLAASGAITQSGGAMTAATLTGGSGGATTLTSGGNAIATLASFSSNGGFALADGSTLSVTGPVTDSASIGFAVNGDLSLAGILTAPILTTAATGAISQPGGSVQVTTLTGSAGSASFGQTANNVSTLGAFASTAGFALTDATPLTVAGAVTGTAITIVDDGLSFGAAGSLAAPGGTVQLAALSTAGLTVGGGGITGSSPITATRLVLGKPTGGPVTITGAFNLAGVTTLDLESAGAIGETGPGAIAVDTLVGSGASATLNGANAIGTLGGFTTTAGFALQNTQGLIVNGPLAANIAALTVAGNLSLSGVVTVPTLSLTAGGDITQGGNPLTTTLLTGSARSATFTAANAIATIGPFSTTNALTVNDAGALSVIGPLNTGTTSLAAGGSINLAASVNGTSVSIDTLDDITQQSGTITAGTLSGSARSGLGVANFTGANRIDTLGRFAAGTLTLNDTGALTIGGPVVANALTVQSGALVVNGAVSANNFTIATTGGITQSGGTLAVGGLTGSTGTSVSLGQAGRAAVNRLGAFTVGSGTFTLADATALTITGPLSAADLAVSATGQLVLAGGTISTTGLPLAQQRAAAPTAPGSYLQVLPDATGASRFIQTGTTTIQPLGGGMATLRIDLPGVGGNLTLDGLSARNTDLVLSLGLGGTATGVLNVADLLVLGRAGHADLTGSVAGITGFTAAEISHISPAFDTRYLLNGCAIMSISCVVQSSIIVPQAFLRPDLLSLDVLNLSVTRDRDDPTL